MMILDQLIKRSGCHTKSKSREVRMVGDRIRSQSRFKNGSGVGWWMSGDARVSTLAKRPGGVRAL